MASNMFSGLGLGYSPVYGNVQNPNGGGFGGGGGGGGGGGMGQGQGASQFQLAGTLVDPFTGSFGQSWNTMNNLGANLGSQFGAINSMNSAANQANQDRAQRQNMFNTLSQLLGQYQNAPRAASIRFGDTRSSQSAG